MIPGGDRTIVKVEEREGTLLYSDDLGRATERVLGHASVTLCHQEHGPPMYYWRTVGPIGLVAEALAAYYLQNPGLKEAVDGMFVMQLKRRLGSGL